MKKKSTLKKDGGAEVYVAQKLKELGVLEMLQKALANGKTLAAHARSSDSVIQCVRHGIDYIYHASFVNEEALDLLEAHKEKHFVAPGLAWLICTAREAGDYGIKPGSYITQRYERELEHAVEAMKKMHKRGIRVVLAGFGGLN